MTARAALVWACKMALMAVLLGYLFVRLIH